MEKHNAIVLTTTNRVIHIGDIIVDSIEIAADGANGDCDVYEGVTDKAEKKVHLEALSGTSFHYHGPALFKNGIYIKVNASTTNVMVTYRPL